MTNDQASKALPRQLPNKDESLLTRLNVWHKGLGHVDIDSKWICLRDAEEFSCTGSAASSGNQGIPASVTTPISAARTNTD